ncbi:hypothetical protein [Leptospira interrogans]|uniref:hypothetical protein n=1 Tax=Leptospira interrogans TaxID=173 RepID=UPI0007747724|nr:hypothetical protein [Leptospira interrogans]
MIYLKRQSLSIIQIQTKIYSDLSSRGKDLGSFSVERVVPTKLLHRLYFSLRYDIGNFPRFRSYCNFLKGNLLWR